MTFPTIQPFKEWSLQWFKHKSTGGLTLSKYPEYIKREGLDYELEYRTVSWPRAKFRVRQLKKAAGPYQLSVRTIQHKDGTYLVYTRQN